MAGRPDEERTLFDLSSAVTQLALLGRAVEKTTVHHRKPEGR
jgi:hypothetical protein